MVPRAHFGPIPLGRAEISIDEPHFRWMREHGTLHIPDVRAQNDFPMLGSIGGWRTLLNAPLRQQGDLVGLLNARRIEVRPFTPAQIKLLETFADQAVIALENVRLFQELKEALEQQTATSEILGVIASSPTDIQPVLDVVAERAARLCDANDSHIRLIDGTVLRLVASYGSISLPEEYVPINRDRPASRAIIDRQTIHIHDLQAVRDREFPDIRDVARGVRSLLAVPLLREGIPIGVIIIRRLVVHPFSDKQIALLKTFADQAVIAIENVRLFQELQVRNRDLTEALEQQTATSEILRVIAAPRQMCSPFSRLSSRMRCAYANRTTVRSSDLMARLFTWPQTTTLRRSSMLTRHLNGSVQGEKVRLDESDWSGGQCIYPMFSLIQNL